VQSHAPIVALIEAQGEPLAYGAAYADDMSSDDKPGAASDETKRKFREALERKKQQSHDRPAHLDGEGAVHESHGRAEKKREFRRKSG
jgi:hypothetical protein